MDLPRLDGWGFIFYAFVFVLLFAVFAFLERWSNNSEDETLRDLAEYRVAYIAGLRAAARQQGRSSTNEDLVLPPPTEYELELERQLLLLRKKKRQKEEQAAFEVAHHAEVERQAREG